MIQARNTFHNPNPPCSSMASPATSLAVAGAGRGHGGASGATGGGSATRGDAGKTLAAERKEKQPARVPRAIRWRLIIAGACMRVKVARP